MALNGYLTDTQSLLGDPAGQFYSTTSLTNFINKARNRVAASGECVRWLPPSGTGQNQTVAGQEVYPFSFVNTLLIALIALSPITNRNVPDCTNARIEEIRKGSVGTAVPLPRLPVKSAPLPGLDHPYTEPAVPSVAYHKRPS